MAGMEYYVETRFRGWRFDNSAIPLSLLRTVASWDKIAYELARECYLQDNPNRRLPYGFRESTRMSLTGIKKGSAVAVMVARPTLMLGEIPYIEKAFNLLMNKIRNNDLVFPMHITRRLIGLRHGLSTDESIELITSSDTNPVAFTYELEMRLASFLTEQHFNVLLDELEWQNTSLTLPVDKSDTETLADPEHSVRMISLQETNPTKTHDVLTRLDEFHNIHDGWLDQSSIAPPHEGLNWIAASWMTYYPLSLPSPHIFPTPEGGISIEWEIENQRIILEVNLRTHHADWLQWNKLTDEEISHSFDLNTLHAWGYIADTIRKAVTNIE